jgi:hypothetical protein
MNVLVPAYACDPHRGSEPGVGWAWSLEIARRGHSGWILTRLKNVAVINEAAALEPQISLQPVGYDLLTWLRGWKSGARGGANLLCGVANRCTFQSSPNSSKASV